MIENVNWEVKDIMKKQIVVTWSGGIDSTALIAQLLNAGFEIFAYRLSFYGDNFEKREKTAIKELLPKLKKLGKLHFEEKDGNFLWNFSPDKIEIPRRNRLILDHFIETICKPKKIYNIGLGEYIGTDTWVIKDHVGGADADHRALTYYIYSQYGLNFRFWSLADFGESRFKHHRVKLGKDIIGSDMDFTTNCLTDNILHCGECYKCIERYVAFNKIFGKDNTSYKKDPSKNERYKKYIEQMKWR